MAGIKQSQRLTLTSLDYLMFSVFIRKEEPVVVRPTGSTLSLQPRWKARPALQASQSWGQGEESLLPPFPQKGPIQIAVQGVRAAFLSGSLELGLSWTEKSPGNVSSCRCL